MKPPFTCILCPTDLSAAGDRAVDLAYALVGGEGIVHLLHVFEPTYVLSPVDGTPLAAYPYTAAGQVAAEQKVQAHLKRLHPTPDAAGGRGVRTERHVVHDSDPAATIEREAQRLGADLIVMGTHGRTGLGRVLMGSVATAVLKKSRTPVLLFHEEAAPSASE